MRIALHPMYTWLLGASVVLACALAAGCGGSRVYDASSRTISCGRAGLVASCVQRGVSSRRQRVSACYEAERATQPSLAGTLTIELTIEPDGETSGVHAQDDTVGSPALRECVLAVLDELRFTPPPTDGPVTHSVPLVFEPGGR